ncbi:transposase [Fulvivirga maritima]|uniref:REP-associated tyrosine transposase n=1 Tax=Fulvivirga maritima TaxID=2904247 RepID=UPI001F45643C|nr:transposase [Fulvivirga maritima]UII28759.1 transposase [Fulvivirga maritima]
MSGGYKIRNQSGIHFLSFAVVEWIDVFTRRVYCELIVESLNHCVKQKGLIVYAWVIMSNHLHLIVAAKNDNLSDVLRDFKKFTAREILKSIHSENVESRKNWMLWLFRSAGANNNRNKGYQFWRQDNHPEELETNNFKDQKLDYIHSNPVKAGIVDEPEQYCWSSARDYAGMQGLVKIEFL